MSEVGTREEYHILKWDITYGKDDCPFCDVDANKESIIWKGKHWFIIHNTFPYTGQKNHLMAVPFIHKKFSHELENFETEELTEVYKQIQKFYAQQIYFSFTRESLANRSVEHLHIHFVPGKLQGKYIRNMLMKQGFPVVQNLD